MSDKRIIREDPGPQRRGRYPGQTGENPETRRVINTVVRTPNVWFRIESIGFVDKQSRDRLSAKGHYIVKKAAKEGHLLKAATRKQGDVVKLFVQAVVEG